MSLHLFSGALLISEMKNQSLNCGYKSYCYYSISHYDSKQKLNQISLSLGMNTVQISTCSEKKRFLSFKSL